MSKEYTKFERKLALVLKKFPNLKNKVKIVYQYFQYLIHKKKDSSYCSKKITPIEFEDHETFFGYYDNSPLNLSQSKILLHASSFSTKNKPKNNKPIKIVLKDFITNKVLYVDSTSTYNWQQGAKLQWLDDQFFVYNFYDENLGKLKSKKVCSETFEVSLYDYPIYDTFGNFAIGLNYRRLAKMRPDYGYFNFDKRFDTLNDSNDGIYSIDLENNTNKMLFSIDDVKNVKFESFFNNAKHKLNHVMLSPNGNLFIFLHRWFVDGVKTDRLFLYDIYKKDFKILLEDGMISHYFWRDDTNIVAYARTIKNGDKYYNINVRNLKIDVLDFDINGKYGDGHPNIFEQNLMLIDTYPNKSRNKSLFVLNLKIKSVQKIGEFLEPLTYLGETRCDLHPRWSPKGDYIFIDSVHEFGKRKLYCIKFK